MERTGRKAIVRAQSERGTRRRKMPLVSKSGAGHRSSEASRDRSGAPSLFAASTSGATWNAARHCTLAKAPQIRGSDGSDAFHTHRRVLLDDRCRRRERAIGRRRSVEWRRRGQRGWSCHRRGSQRWSSSCFTLGRACTSRSGNSSTRRREYANRSATQQCGRQPTRPQPAGKSAEHFASGTQHRLYRQSRPIFHATAWTCATWCGVVSAAGCRAKRQQ